MAKPIYSVKIPKIEPGSQLLVQVTHINNPGWFFVRPSSLQEFVEEMEGPTGVSRPIRVDELRPGSRVIYNSSTSRKLIRGKVIEVNGLAENRYCDIHSIDYGWVDTDVSVNDIYIPKEAGAAAPTTAIQCELNYCFPVGNEFDERANEVMRRFIRNEDVEMTVRSIDFARAKVITELRAPTCTDNLSTVLAYMRCSARAPRFNNF